MASGESVIQILDVQIPAVNGAALTMRAGGSTPAERFVCYAFDAATIEYLDFKCLLSSNYDGGGLTITLPWMGATATTGVCRLETAVRRIQDDTENVGTAHTYDYNAVDDTVASVSGELSYPTLVFTNGVDMDSWAAGEIAVVRVRRNASHVNDTMAGDAQLVGFWAMET